MASPGPASVLDQDAKQVGLISSNRVYGFVIVLAVAFARPILVSLYFFLGHKFEYSASTIRYGYIDSIVTEIIAVGLLFYVLRQNGTRPSTIGFSWSAGNLRPAFFLILGGYFVYLIAYSIVRYSYHYAFGQSQSSSSLPMFGTAISAPVVLLVLVNPFFEELIVRAFTMSEIELLTGSRPWAVFVSVSLQTTYHLYQGVEYALPLGAMFLLYSLYYVRTRRIMPVIVAHFWCDLSALVIRPLVG